MFLYLGVKNRLEKSPTPKKYIETPLLVVWRNTKSSKDFNFTITKDISKEDTISLNDVKTNCNLNNALNKSISRVLLKNKDISWRYVSEIFQSESAKTTKRLSIDTFSSARFESDSESFTSKGVYDESETEIEQNTPTSPNELSQNRPSGLSSNLDSGRCSTPKKVLPAIKIPIVTEDEESFLNILKTTESVWINVN